MRLLFVKLKHIGDTLLLTPTLVAARKTHPDAEIWVVVRKGCEDILRGCTAVNRILTSAAPEAKQRSSLNWLNDLRLLAELRGKHFDYAFELTDGDRGRVLAGLSGARVRGLTTYGFKPNWWWRRWFNAFTARDLGPAHRVERDYFIVNDLLPLNAAEIPSLSFEKSAIQPWSAADSLIDFAVIHPGTRWLRKRWPVEKWIELCRWLLERTERIVVSCGPDPEEAQMAAEIESAMGGRILNTAGKLTWAQLAGLLYRSRLFVGVDTAAMHLAAACQTPTVALFGPSLESQWRPWKVAHRIVRPQDALSEGELARIQPEALMGYLEVAAVAKACEEMIQSCSR